MTQLYGVIRIPAIPPPAERYRRAREARYRRRLQLLGMRPASITKALARGFPGPWVRACRTEMQRVLWDLAPR